MLWMAKRAKQLNLPWMAGFIATGRLSRSRCDTAVGSETGDDRGSWLFGIRRVRLPYIGRNAEYL